MPSSIFNFDSVQGYFHLPQTEKKWHGLLAGGALLCLIGSSFVIRMVYTDWPAPSVHQMAFRTISADTQVLFLGASLVRTSIIPDYFDRPTVNLSIDAGNYQTAELLLEHNLDRMPNLKVAVLEIDNLMQWYDRLKYPDFNQLYEQGVPVRAMRHLSLGETISQYLMCNPLAQPFFFNNRLNPRDLRYQSSTIQWHLRPGSRSSDFIMTEEELAKRDLSQDETLLQSPSREDNLAALHRMIRTLLDRNIQVVLLRYPQLRQYAEIKSDEWNRSYQELVDGILNQYEGQVTYWDFLSVQGIGLGDFGDTHHLNTYGASAFSRIVSERIELEFFSQAIPPSDLD